MTYPNDTVAINRNNIRQAIQLDDRAFDGDDILSNGVFRSVSDGYFATINSKLIQGRTFTADDDEQGANVIIINKKLSDKWWPNESAINHQLSFDQGTTWYNIVGIIENIHERGAAIEPDFQIYQAIAQAPMSHIAILAKYENSELAVNFNDDIKNIIAQLDNRQPISKFETLQQAVDNSVSLQSFLAQLLTIFSIIALLITISGVSGVMSYMVNLRTREIGIRMAIGADKTKVMVLILSYGLKLTLLGLTIGVIAAYFSGDWLSAQLFDIQPFNLSIYSAALGVLMVISVVACLLPAWRASSIPPMRALKQ